MKFNFFRLTVSKNKGLKTWSFTYIAYQCVKIRSASLLGISFVNSHLAAQLIAYVIP